MITKLLVGAVETGLCWHPAMKIAAAMSDAPPIDLVFIITSKDNLMILIASLCGF
jgi:hypothetical protein